MKKQCFLAMAAIFALLFFPACKDEGDAARDAAVQSIQQGQQPPAGDANANPTTATTEPAQNPAGIWHYTCPKGCAGGGGTAAACATCGTTLVHNAAYHPAPDPTAATAPANSATSLPPGVTPVESPIKNPEPAQNTKGVWHYTCSAGCAGGAGSAIACAKCGKTLAHNQTYHQ